MNLSDLRWFYVRDKNNHPVGCVVSIRIKNSTEEESKNRIDDFVAFEYSSLNPKDSWDVVDGKHSPHFGRGIAKARLEKLLEAHWKVFHFGLYVYPNLENKSIKEQIMEYLATAITPYYTEDGKHVQPSYRLVKAAQYWLSEEGRANRMMKRLKEQQHGHRNSAE